MTDSARLTLLRLLERLSCEAGDPAEYRRQVAALTIEAERMNAAAPVADLANGQRIRDARKELGLSLREAGAKLDTSAAALCRWERGDSPCNADLVIAVMRGDPRAKLPRRFSRPRNRKGGDAE